MNKSNACGIVVEYNPLHTGHIHHITESRKHSRCDVLIAVMSPYFVQRGDIAIVSPIHRAKAAIEAGVDIVIELPYPYCSEHADKFAQGAIQTLSYLNIDSLCFGSESNDIEKLKQLKEELTITAKSTKQKTQSMAASNHNDHSNDILGLAYLKALEGTSITPLTIQRTNTYRSEEITTSHASASAIRRAFYDSQENKEINIEEYTPLSEVIQQHHLPYLASHYSTIRYLLCTQSPDFLKTMFLMDEGMEGLLIKQAQANHNFDDFLNACTSKRYTKARITRTLTHLLLQTTKERAKQLEELQFVRILAMNERGQQYLKQLRKIRKHEEEKKANNTTDNNTTDNNTTDNNTMKDNTTDNNTMKDNTTEDNKTKESLPIIASRFNQLPPLYQEEVMKHLHVVYGNTSEERFQKALQEELSYPLLCKSEARKE